MMMMMKCSASVGFREWLLWVRASDWGRENPSGQWPSGVGVVSCCVGILLYPAAPVMSDTTDCDTACSESGRLNLRLEEVAKKQESI